MVSMATGHHLFAAHKTQSGINDDPEGKREQVRGGSMEGMLVAAMISIPSVFTKYIMH